MFERRTLFLQNSSSYQTAHQIGLDIEPHCFAIDISAPPLVSISGLTFLSSRFRSHVWPHYRASFLGCLLIGLIIGLDFEPHWSPTITSRNQHCCVSPLSLDRQFRVSGHSVPVLSFREGGFHEVVIRRHGLCSSFVSP